jgi:hypothetical protein
VDALTNELHDEKSLIARTGQPVVGEAQPRQLGEPSNLGRDGACQCIHFQAVYQTKRMTAKKCRAFMHAPISLFSASVKVLIWARCPISVGIVPANAFQSSGSGQPVNHQHQTRLLQPRGALRVRTRVRTFVRNRVQVPFYISAGA